MSWNYTFTISMSDNNAGEIDFFTSLLAGAHQFGGASLQVKGAGTFSFVKPAAAPGNVDLSVTKTALTTVSPGQALNYSIAYNNAGPSGATNIQLTDVLPAGVTLASSCTGSCHYDTITRQISWSLGSLASGASGTKTYQVTVNSSDPNNFTFTNNARIFSAENDTNTANNASSVTTTVKVPSISGTVIDDGTSGGLAGATVRLCTTNNCATGTQVGSTITTDATGNWSFSGTGVNVNATYFVLRTNPTGYTSTSAAAGSGALSTATVETIDRIKVVLGAAGTYSSNNEFHASGVHSTSTAVSCTSPVVINQGSTCTATVTDTSGSPTTPSGTINFSESGAGVSPASTSCTLSSGSCQVTLTGNSTGTISITGSYQGDGTHSTSSGNASITVNKRDSSTSVTCSPASVVINQGSVCTATVSDASANGTAIRPTGTVSFSKGAGDAGSFDNLSCNLPATGTNSCSVTYTPSAAGSSTITGTYGSDSNHTGSNGNDTVTATKRDSSTSVTCSPASVVINQGSVCTATVSDASANGTAIRPTGTVSFSKGAGDAGSFDNLSCNLPATGTNSCSVTYTPSAAGSSTITGTYGSDSNHNGSNGNDTVTATKRDSSTSVTCSPASVVINQGSVCTATVSDASANGTAIRPTGTVSFSKGAGDAGSFDNLSCNLPATGTNSCSVTYTPSAAGSSTITGTYGSDSNHTGSNGNDTVTATKRDSSTSVTCSPASVVINQGSVCTATVSDASANGTAIRPTGTVSFSKGAGDAGSFDNLSCNLPATGTNSCSVTYTPSAAGSSTITGTYGSDSNHTGSNGNDTVTATKRDSSTSVTCSPASVVINQGSVCTATVSDASANGTAIRPTGTVSFSKGAGDAGSFDNLSCNLPATRPQQLLGHLHPVRRRQLHHHRHLRQRQQPHRQQRQRHGHRHQAGQLDQRQLLAGLGRDQPGFCLHRHGQRRQRQRHRDPAHRHGQLQQGRRRRRQLRQPQLQPARHAAPTAARSPTPRPPPAAPPSPAPTAATATTPAATATTRSPPPSGTARPASPARRPRS